MVRSNRSNVVRVLLRFEIKNYERSA